MFDQYLDVRLSVASQALGCFSAAEFLRHGLFGGALIDHFRDDFGTLDEGAANQRIRAALADQDLV